MLTLKKVVEISEKKFKSRKISEKSKIEISVFILVCDFIGHLFINAFFRKNYII